MVVVGPGVISSCFAHGSDKIAVALFKGNQYHCQVTDQNSTPVLRRRNGRYVSYPKRIAELTQERRQSPAKRRTAINQELTRLRAVAPRARAACRTLIVPSPPSSPTPTPRPSPTPSLAWFDDNGRLTEIGHRALRVPLEFESSIESGALVYAQFCVGCHVERGAGRDFFELRAVLGRSEMAFINRSLSDYALGNLLAYLNRESEHRQ